MAIGNSFENEVLAAECDKAREEQENQLDLFSLTVETTNHDGRITRKIHFDGADYQPERDKDRLVNQASKIHNVVKGGKWFTLGEISNLTGAPEASVSAHLRDYRKPRLGAHTVERTYIGNGLYTYSVILDGDKGKIPW